LKNQDSIVIGEEGRVKEGEVGMWYGKGRLLTKKDRKVKKLREKFRL